MSSDDVFCRLEMGVFPKKDFIEVPEWGLVHQTERPHTTLGSYIDDDFTFQGMGGH